MDKLEVLDAADASDMMGVADATCELGVYDALVVIDVQQALVDAHPAGEDRFLAALEQLVGAARHAGVPVLHVCHDGGPGDELERGTDGWREHSAVAPHADEVVINKHFNSAFRQTDLHERLQALGAQRLVLCGMQTEFCFDVSVKVAFELGYDVTIPREAVATFDTDFASGEALTTYFADHIWHNRYAQVRPVSKILRDLGGVQHER